MLWLRSRSSHIKAALWMEFVIMNIEEIEIIFAINGEILKTSELYRNGITKYEVKKYVDMGVLERVSQGYFKLSATEISDAKLIALMIPDAVLCLDTALFYYGYSDRTPRAWHIAVNKDSSKAKVRIDYPFIKAYFVEREILDVGVERIVMNDVELKIYSRDRLICDCLKYEKKMDVETFNKALLNYINDPKKNISKLIEYAKIRGVTKKVYDKIGTWL